MPQIVPIKDLRKTTEISELCHSKNEPIFVTKNGYGDLVVMSVETYDCLMGTRDVDNAIISSEEEISKGVELLDAKSVLKDLRGKHFG
ncbi:MAG: prevent-host-death protein [Clostridiales bacterium]|nr:MAG: prevent-host-death protein [Clostridiales bacterium]